MIRMNGTAAKRVLLGLTVLTLPLLSSCGGNGTGPRNTAAPEVSADAVKGPHRGRLLAEEDLQIEVTIYESGVPPEFRVYLYEAGEEIVPEEVQLTIHLQRLGGRVDVIAFQPKGGYLLGDKVVEEPHSFAVEIEAKWRGRTYRMGYSQIEARVEMSPEAVSDSGIVVEEAGPARLRLAFQLPGEIALNPDRVAHVVPRFSGVVTEVRTNLGDAVARGEVIAVIDSQELADSKLVFIQALHQLKFAQASFEREEQLWAKRISALEEYLTAQQTLEEAEISTDGAQQKLRSLGLLAAEIKGLADRQQANLARYQLRAPIRGVVIEKHVALGEVVEGYADLFKIADLSTVLAKVTVYGQDLKSVRVGQEVRVESDVLGIETSGTVSYLGSILGAETRTATAHVSIPNPEGVWRPGVFVTTQLVREETTVPVAVRPESIQQLRDWSVVFIQDGDLFEARPLELGRRDGEWVEVLAGLSAGQRYVSKNSFLVKADILKSGATHDH